jgi:Cu/Ag efflux pump CusA
VLYLTGATFNILVVAGLVMALAIVVEDAITDVDNIKRRLREREAGGAQEATDSVIVSAITEMRSSLIVGSLIVLLSVLPLFFLNGPSGEFFPPMVLAYALAVITAMLVSLTVTPALAMFLLANAPASRQESPFARMIKGRYGAAFAGVVQKPSLPYLALAIMAVLGITAAAQLSQPSLLPEFKQRDLLIHWDGPAGTSEPEMNRIVSAAATELQSIPGVENVGAHVGRAITSDQVVGINSGEIWVRVAGDADYNGTVSTIREVVDGYPGLSHEVVTYPKERVRQLLTGNDDDLTVRLYGEQLSVLRPEADKLRQSISGVQGVASPQVKLPVVEPTIEVEVDLAAAASNGLNPGEIRRAATTYLASLFVGALFEQNKVFEVVVWSTPETRANLDKVRALPIQKADGTAVPLDQVADVRIAANPNVIQREAVSRYLDITADISGRDRGAVVSDIENLLQRSTFPLEYHAEVIDSDKGLPDQTNSGLPLAIAAAVIMFLLLQLAFGSWRLAALFFVTMPAALAGGALAAFVDGADLTIGSYAGFLALLAITARSCIVMVRRYRDLQQQAGGAITDDLVLTATQERVAPILVTAVATFLALLPLIFVGDVFGHEVITPMAIVMIGGLITSTFYTLFIVPALYLHFAPAPASEKQRSQLRIRQKEAPAS